MSIRLTKFSGRTSFAIAAKSSGLRMSCFGNSATTQSGGVSAVSASMVAASVPSGTCRAGTRPARHQSDPCGRSPSAPGALDAALGATAVDGEAAWLAPLEPDGAPVGATLPTAGPLHAERTRTIGMSVRRARMGAPPGAVGMLTPTRPPGVAAETPGNGAGFPAGGRSPRSRGRGPDRASPVDSSPSADRAGSSCRRPR